PGPLPRPRPAPGGLLRPPPAQELGGPGVTWHIGAVTVTKLPQMTWHLPITAFLPDAPEGPMEVSIHGLLVESGGRRILVDTCAGHDEGAERFLAMVRRAGSITHHHDSVADALVASGRAVAEVDTVVCTH